MTGRLLLMPGGLWTVGALGTPESQQTLHNNTMRTIGRCTAMRVSRHNSAGECALAFTQNGLSVRLGPRKVCLAQSSFALHQFFCSIGICYGQIYDEIPRVHISHKSIQYSR